MASRTSTSPPYEESNSLVENGQLHELGFSVLAAQSYLRLYSLGSVSIGKLAKSLGQSPSNLYRALIWLEKRGFVKCFKTVGTPTYVRAVKLEDALDDFFNYQKQLVMPIIREQRQSREPG